MFYCGFLSRSTQGSNGSGSGFKVSQKSHPTDWGKPGIDPATPGLQGTG